jgi:hypothetical protein
MPWLMLLAISSASEYPCAINGLLTIQNSGKTKDDYSSHHYAELRMIQQHLLIKYSLQDLYLKIIGINEFFT